MDGIFKVGGDEEQDAEAEESGIATGMPCSSSPFHVNAETETSLTQLFEEGLEAAADVSDDDFL